MVTARDDMRKKVQHFEAEEKQRLEAMVDAAVEKLPREFCPPN
jgi:hypothetical protein